jgi:type I restriction enzyme S subunit
MEQYELPNRWEWRNLGGVDGLKPACKFLDYLRVPVNEKERSRRSGPFPYYGANGQQGWIDDYLFDEELVLLAEDGGFFFDPLKPASYRVSGKCWVNNHAHVLRPAPDVDPDWLNLTLAFTDYTPFIPEPVRPKLNQKNAKRIEVPVPPLAEQRRIVARIEGLTRRVEEARRLHREVVEETERYIPAAIASVFGEGQTERWVTRKVKDICEKPQYGYTESARHQAVGPKFLRITDIQDGKVDWETVPYCRCDDIDKYRLKSGDIVFARTGATTGKSFLVIDPPEAVFASYLIRLRVGPSILPEFLYWYFQSSTYWAAVTSGIDDGNRPNMNGSKLANLEIPYPEDKREQRRIVNYLNGLQFKIEELKRLQAETESELTAFTPALLAKAFRGEL